MISISVDLVAGSYFGCGDRLHSRVSQCAPAASLYPEVQLYVSAQLVGPILDWFTVQAPADRLEHERTAYLHGKPSGASESE